MYEVHVMRTMTTTVTVDADSPEEALALVDQRAFELPAADTWDTLKGSYEYEVEESA